MQRGNPIKCAHCGAMARYDMPCCCGYGTVLCPNCARPMIKLARCEYCARAEEDQQTCTDATSQATIEDSEEASDGDRNRS